MKIAVAAGAAAAERIAAAKRIAAPLLAIGARIKAARIAIGVNLAGIEFGALVLVAQHVIGRGQFLETLLGFLVAGMGVGMVLLGQAAEGLFDLGLRGALGHAQSLVGIAHSVSCRRI